MTDEEQTGYDVTLRRLLQQLAERRCLIAWENLWERCGVRVLAVFGSAIVVDQGPDLLSDHEGPTHVAYHPDGLTHGPGNQLIPLRDLTGAWRLVYAALRERMVVYTWPLRLTLADLDPHGLTWYERVRTAPIGQDRDEILIQYAYQLGLLEAEPEQLIQLVRLYYRLGLGGQYHVLGWLL